MKEESQQQRKIKTKVAILGAGCSCSCGFPLAHEFQGHLAEFAVTVEKLSQPKLLKLIRTALALFDALSEHGIKVKTLDELARCIYQGQHGERDELKNFRLVEEAKAAVSAMFLSYEDRPAARLLTGYKSLFYKLFGSATNYRLAFQDTPWRVLTFNYDRLFELAIKQHFQLDPRVALYGQAVLNSGLDPLRSETVKVNTSRFSLLKLHGSVGFSSVEEYGQCNHYHREPDFRQPVPMLDETFFFGDGHGPIYSNWVQPSLILFPHEPRLLEEYPGNKLPHRTYWPEIRNAARGFLLDAEEIQIIGYSVAEPDWDILGDLLRAAKTCERIIVKNRQPTKVCDNLRELLPHFVGEIRPVEFVFE